MEEVGVLYDKFSDEEKEIFWGCVAVLTEERGAEAKEQSERDAAAAILQHQRLHAPRDFTVEELKTIEKSAALLMKKGYTAQRAEQIAYEKAIAQKSH